MTTDTKVFLAHVPLRQTERIDKMAARMELSRGPVAKQVLVAWLDQEEQHTRLTV